MVKRIPASFAGMTSSSHIVILWYSTPIVPLLGSIHCSWRMPPGPSACQRIVCAKPSDRTEGDVVTERMAKALPHTRDCVPAAIFQPSAITTSSTSKIEAISCFITIAGRPVVAPPLMRAVMKVLFLIAVHTSRLMTATSRVFGPRKMLPRRASTSEIGSAVETPEDLVSHLVEIATVLVVAL